MFMPVENGTSVPKQLDRSELILYASSHGKTGRTGAPATRFCGVTTSAVNRLGASKELDEVKTHP